MTSHHFPVHRQHIHCILIHIIIISHYRLNLILTYDIIILKLYLQLLGTKAHVNPTDLPWQPIQVLISQSLYGGRIDNKYDQVGIHSQELDVDNINIIILLQR